MSPAVAPPRIHLEHVTGPHQRLPIVQDGAVTALTLAGVGVLTLLLSVLAVLLMGAGS